MPVAQLNTTSWKSISVSPSCSCKAFSQPFLEGCLSSHFNETLLGPKLKSAHKAESFAWCLVHGRQTGGWSDRQILQKLHHLDLLWRESINKWCNMWKSEQKFQLYFMSCSKHIFNSEILELYGLYGTWRLQQEMNYSLACCMQRANILKKKGKEKKETHQNVSSRKWIKFSSFLLLEHIIWLWNDRGRGTTEVEVPHHGTSW